jgi:3-oxoacyl-[acyl-carrier-protein] synthase III
VNSFSFCGFGYYLPKKCVDSNAFEERFKLSQGTVFRQYGVQTRHHVEYETSVGMGALASRTALSNVVNFTQNIDTIIVASSAPQQGIPCTAVLLQNELGILDGSCFSFDINATCISFLVALDVTLRFGNEKSERTTLLCSSEIASISVNPDDLETSALFGDAAASLVIQTGANCDSLYFGSSFRTFSSAKDASRFLGAGTLFHPNNSYADKGINYFSMNGSALLRIAIGELPRFFFGFLAKIEWALEEVDLIIPHQASLHGLQILYRILKIPHEKVFVNLDTVGNCVAASIPLALCQALEKGVIKSGSKVILLGVAAGVSMGAIAFQL